MRHCCCFYNLKGLLFLFLTLHLVLNGFIVCRESFIDLQEQMSYTRAVSIEEDDVQLGSCDFKPPKYSFIDYASYFQSNNLIPSYLPTESRLQIDDVQQEPEPVYRDIFVPPQNHS